MCTIKCSHSIELKENEVACSNPHWEFDIHHEPHASKVCRKIRFPIEDVLQI